MKCLYQTNKKSMPVLVAALIIFVVLLVISNAAINASAEDSSTVKIIDEINKNSNEQVDKLNTDELADFIDSLNNDEYQLFGGGSLKDVLSKIISGEFKMGADSFLSAILTFAGRELLSCMPTLASITIIAVLCGILSQMRPSFLSKSVGEIVYFACYGAIILLMMNSMLQLIGISSDTVASMKSQMNMVFPILLTLMAAIGGTVSVKVYQPAVALLSSGITEVVCNIILPMFIVTIVFTVVSNLSSSVKLSKMADFFKQSATWLIGIIFTVFVAFLSIQGITAATYDGISIRAAKFATKSYIPVLGGYLSDGFDLILASSVLVKNAFGLTGLILLLATILVPIVKIVIFMLGLKLVSAVIEPITDKRISDFVSSISKNITLLIIAILAVAFMYIITIMLVIFTSNAIV